MRARLGDRFVYVRAAMIIGPGSASYDILEHLVKRLPVMIVPKWLDTKTQPIALSDVVRALADVAERETAPDELQLGGADVLTYREMMRRAAPLMGRRPPLVIRVPVLTPRLSSYWVALVTPVSYGLDQAARRRPGRRDDRRAATRPRASTTSRSASRKRSGGARVKLLNRQGERRIANAVLADPGGAHRHGRRRRGPLDPGGERRHARGRADRAVEAGQPRAARPDLLEVPLAGDARDHPRRPTPTRSAPSW